LQGPKAYLSQNQNYIGNLLNSDSGFIIDIFHVLINLKPSGFNLDFRVIKMGQTDPLKVEDEQ
jgi:hypothetical protein